MTTEIRTIAVDGIELRDHAENGPGMSFRGYAAVFNSDSEPLPFIEQVAPGAFRRSLNARNNVRMLLNHDTSKVLGATRSKTLRLSEDSTGLLVDADLPPTSYGRDLSISMQRGDIESMSFGFSVPAKGDTWSEDGQRRTLNEVRLHEVSVVTFPA
jgi:HK97 family phage prohead protease